MSVPVTTKIKDLLLKYVYHLGLKEGVLGKELIFLFNALTINVEEEKNIIEFGLKNNITITVVDQANITGDVSSLSIKV